MKTEIDGGLSPEIESSEKIDYERLATKHIRFAQRELKRSGGKPTPEVEYLLNSASVFATLELARAFRESR